MSDADRPALPVVFGSLLEPVPVVAKIFALIAADDVVVRRPFEFPARFPGVRASLPAGETLN